MGLIEWSWLARARLQAICEDAVAGVRSRSSGQSTVEYALVGALVVIAAAGGLYSAPPSGVNLLPVLRVDGVEKAAGTRAFGLEAKHQLSLEMRLPGGGVHRIDHQERASRCRRGARLDHRRSQHGRARRGHGPHGGSTAVRLD